MTQIRSGNAANRSGPTYWLLTGKERNPAYTDEFLQANGAAEFSSIVMTPNAFLTDEAWKQIVPLLIKGLRKMVVERAYELGVDSVTAGRLYLGLSFDGFKTHVKNLAELINMAEANILAIVENRDSSAINQAFDKFVAQQGKRRAALCLDQIRRSHVTPIIDQWLLVLVGLAMLRDCNQSNAWENSFIAVNMHPLYRVSFDDWLEKIAPCVKAAEKFETEVIDDFEMLPSEWRNQPLSMRQKWMKIIDEDATTPTWDVDMIQKLRAAGMNLSIVSQIFKIYQTEKRIAFKKAAVSPAPQLVTPPPVAKDKSKMIYHVFNAKIPGATNLQRFQHAVSVRNRTLGPKEGTTVSPHLDVEMTDMNKRMLTLTPADLNMHRVLQESTCRTGTRRRRRVARRCLNALGGVSGLSTFLNDEKTMKDIRLNLKFTVSYEAVKHKEREMKYHKEKQSRDKHYWAAMTKMGLAKDSVVYRKHVKRTKLTIPQIKAVAFVDCGENLKGPKAQVRSELIDLLPVCQDPDTDEDLPVLVPICEDDDGEPVSADTETQDQFANIVLDVPIEKMTIGDCVEVYWKGDKKWYEGRVTGVDLDTRQFEIEYFLDDEVLTHNASEYKVRMAC